MRPTSVAVATVVAVVSVVLGLFLPYIIQVGTGYTAKTICSGVFVSERDAAEVFLKDLPDLAAALVGYRVDTEKKSVTAFVGSYLESTAIYVGRHGCRLTYKGKDHGPGFIKPLTSDSNKAWPQGDSDADAGVSADLKAEVAEVIRKEFQKSNETIQTRAIVVVHRGKIIGEAYGDGFSAQTRLAAWSMTKSLSNLIAGILVKQGRLNVSDVVYKFMPEWTKPHDFTGRHKITLDHLLRARSGLAFEEKYDPWNQATVMLFMRADAASYAADQPIMYEPGARFAYSSGTTNLLSRIFRQAIGNDQEYWDFPYREIFEQIGMDSTALETDASGTFVLSSFWYARARDFARFGLLFLNRGEWLGKQIIDPSWVDYSTSSPDKDGVYGAQWWLAQHKNETDPDLGWHPHVPSSTFYASGFDGQMTAIFPSHDLVVVRLGRTPGAAMNWQPHLLFKPLLKLVEKYNQKDN